MILRVLKLAGLLFSLYKLYFAYRADDGWGMLIWSVAALVCAGVGSFRD